jgi:signal transduction histidine kinase/CheY-like chemotaxis protein
MRDEQLRILERLKQGERVDHFETVWITKTGECLDGSVRLSPLTDVTGAVVAISGIVRDITEWKRSERALEQEREEEARRKDDVLDFMGHELRTPLVAIQTAMYVLSRGPTPAQRARVEETIARQTALMGRLVDDLLEFERSTHGHIQLTLDQLDLADCLRRAVAAVQSTVDGRHQELRLQLPDESVPFIADGSRLDQIIRNLLTNASTSTAPGGKIELSAAREGSVVIIRCKDNGHGIASEYLQHIFEPFSRRPKTAFGYGEATIGLELALAKKLTELHGGTISVESGGPGFGTEFTVRLPFPTTPSVQAVAEELEPAPEKTPPLRVLLVEDHPDLAAVTAEWLSEEGFDVRTALSGREALEVAPLFRPHLVLCDMNLPDIDGLNVVRELRSNPSTERTYVVIVTAMERMELSDRLKRMGVDAFIPKPITIAAIQTLVDKLARQNNATTR